MPNCFNDGSNVDSAPHRYPTHILSPNYCHRMRICQEIGTEQSLKLSFIHSDSRFHCFDALNLCQTASMMKVLWIERKEYYKLNSACLFIPTHLNPQTCTTRKEFGRNDSVLVLRDATSILLPHLWMILSDLLVERLLTWCNDKESLFFVLRVYSSVQMSLLSRQPFDIPR